MVNESVEESGPVQESPSESPRRRRTRTRRASASPSPTNATAPPEVALEAPTPDGSSPPEEAAAPATRRRRRSSGSKAAAADDSTATPTAEQPAPPVEAEAEQPAPTPRRRRSSRSKAATTETAEATTATPVVEEAPPPEAEAAAPRRRRSSRSKAATADAAEATTATPVAEEAPLPEADGEQPAPRRRRRRGGRSKAATTDAAEAIAATPAVEEPPPLETEAEEAAPKPRRRRRRGSRGGASSASAATAATPAVETSEPPAEVDAAKAPARRRRRAATGSRRRGASAAPAAKAFAHPSEEEFSRILDFYGVRWVYEPRSFPLRWDDGRAVELFTPDFYLEDLDLWLELTTLKQNLVTEKNRKLRLLRKLYPEINIKLLYKRDYHRILARYGFGPLARAEIPRIEHVLLSTNQVRERVAELGRQISEDYKTRAPVLVGVLRGGLCFLADLMREVSLPVSVDFLSISTPGAEGGGVRITKELDTSIEGKDVILVEDVVDTGMSLGYIISYLKTKKPASVEVCALLDKKIRRIADVPLRYVGFEVPDEFLVGYGLDYLERYRNLPFIGVLKPEAAEEPAQR